MEDKKRGSRSPTIYQLEIKRRIQIGNRDYQLLCANCNWKKKYENKETGGRSTCANTNNE